MRSLVCWSIGLVAALFAVVGVGLLDTGRPLAAQPAKKSAGLELVPREGMAVLTINLAKLHDSEAGKPIRDALEKGDKTLLRRLESDYGLTLAQLDRLTFFWAEPTYGIGLDSGVAFVTTRQPFDKSKVVKAWKGTDEPRNGGAFCGVPGGQLGGLGLGGAVPPGGIGFGGLVLPGGGIVQVKPAEEPGAPVLPVAKPKELNLNAPFFYCGSDGATVIVPIDDTTLAVLPPSSYGSGPAFLAALLRRKADGPLAEALALADKHDVVFSAQGKELRSQIQMYRALGGPEGVVVDGSVLPFDTGKPVIPPPVDKPNDPQNAEDEFTPYEPLTTLDRATVTFDFGATCKLSVAAQYPTAEAAKKAEPVAKKGMKAVLDLLAEARKATAADAGEKDWLSVFDFALTGLKSAKITQEGKTLTATSTVDLAGDLKAAFVTLPTKVQEKIDQVRLTNNLKQLGLALHNYHDANGHLPRDITDGEGTVLLSWRVELLPYIEANDLAARIDRTKAWDDPVNKKLWDEMPDVFRVPSRPTKEKHETFLQTFRTMNWIGKDDPWQVDTHAVTFTEVTDGTSHTLAITEMEEAKNWMKPGDPTFDPKKLAKIGNPKTGKAGVVMMDGASRTLDAKKYTGEKLAAIITINGSETVDENDFK